MTKNSHNLYPPVPAIVLHEALTGAANNIEPSFGPKAFLRMLQLDGKEPDNRTVADRLLGDSEPQTPI